MLVVVPIKKRSDPSPGILQRTEEIREVGTVFHSLELRLRVRIVIRDARSRMSLGYAQISQQHCQRFGLHRTAAIGMQGQLIRQDPLLVAGLADQFLGQGDRLAIGEQPAWDVATEDVDDDVQLVIGSLRRTQQFGDVPTPFSALPRFFLWSCQ